MDIAVQVTAAAAAAFVAVLVLIPLVRTVAVGYGATSPPRPDRIHDTPTPYLGGVAIVITACAATPFLGHWRPEVAVVVLGAALVGAVGLIDDVRMLRPGPRLAAEAAAAALAVSVGVQVQLFHNPLDWVITIVWLVVVTNAYNLLDNMDGAAGVVATATAALLTVAAVLEGQILVGSLAAVLAGACLGFLIHNWHPARIFMGDAGSLFLGYLLAVITLQLRFPVEHSASIVAVVLLTGPALFDTTLVVISRVRAGQPIYRGGTDHTSHRLMHLGLPQPVVAMLLGAASVTCCGLGVLVGRGVLPPALVASAVVAGGALLLVALLRVPTTDQRRPAPSGTVTASAVAGSR